MKARTEADPKARHRKSQQASGKESFFFGGVLDFLFKMVLPHFSLKNLQPKMSIYEVVREKYFHGKAAILPMDFQNGKCLKSKWGWRVQRPPSLYKYLEIYLTKKLKDTLWSNSRENMWRIRTSKFISITVTKSHANERMNGKEIRSCWTKIQLRKWSLSNKKV